MFGNFGIWELLLVFLVLATLFGTAKLRGMGWDLGQAVKGFRNALRGDEKKDEPKKDGPPKDEPKQDDPGPDSDKPS